MLELKLPVPNRPVGLPKLLISSAAGIRGADMKALKARQVWAILIGLSLGLGARSIAVAQIVKIRLGIQIILIIFRRKSAAPSWPSAENCQAPGTTSRPIVRTHDKSICTSSISIVTRVRPFAPPPVVFMRCTH
jgi:hypothetical protein